MPYGNINVDTVTTSTSGGILGAGNASIMKNRIINGAMVIDQRNAGGAVSGTPAYPVDRWYMYNNTDGTYSAQQDSSAPAGFSKSLKVTVTSADASIGSTQYLTLQQNIEGFNTADLGFGTSDAKTITVSFWVKSSLTGTFGGSIQNAAQNRCYPFSYTISSANTWEQKSVTIAGDTTGTWVGATNGTGLIIYFGFGIGSTFSGTAGAWTGSSYIFAPTGAVPLISTNGATWQATGVQLEVGSTATSFDYRPYGTELALCQRYYWQCTDSMGVMTNTNNAYRTPINMPVPMRTSPTLASGATFTVGGGSTGTPALNISSGSPATTTAVWIYNSSANWTAGNAVSLNAGFTAEL